jgi:hypothetical protein
MENLLSGALKFVDGPMETKCWLCMYSTTRNGYSRVVVNGKNVIAHRYSYEYYKGLIPEDLVVDHLCRVKRCVNPDHLEAVTTTVNNIRSGLVKRRTHCKNGHSYDTAFKKVNGAVHYCNVCADERRKAL